MGRSQYKIYETHFPYFLTSSIVDGIPLFANQEIAQFVLNPDYSPRNFVVSKAKGKK